jgi:hypothetical protein
MKSIITCFLICFLCFGLKQSFAQGDLDTPVLMTLHIPKCKIISFGVSTANPSAAVLIRVDEALKKSLLTVITLANKQGLDVEITVADLDVRPKKIPASIQFVPAGNGNLTFLFNDIQGEPGRKTFVERICSKLKSIKRFPHRSPEWSTGLFDKVKKP